MNTKLAAALPLVLALVAPGLARAEATISSREVPTARRALSAVEQTSRFTMVGVHWQGSGTVRFRTRRVDGGWSRWRTARPDPHAPSGDGWRRGELLWTGASDRIAYRTTGSVARLRTWFVWSPVERLPLRTVSRVGAPLILPRLSWGANETIVRNHVRYAPTLRAAVVHATAGAAPSSPAQSAAIVRGIQLYHVRGNGWDDIGYNFLIDPFGQVFEGRRGGIERNVVGAHTAGFNTGTVGVSVLGRYSARGISPAAQTSLAALLAWRLDLAYVDPLSLVGLVSGGNRRFPAGIPVTRPAIATHRDYDFTEDPGDAFYAQIPAIARLVSRTGLPKLYAPSASAGPEGSVRFRARLSRALPWTVTVADALGQTTASGSGQGVRVDWTWDGAVAVAGRYRWTISAPGARPATGTIGRRPAAVLSLRDLRVEPQAVASTDGGHEFRASAVFVLGAPALVTARLVGGDGQTVTTPFSQPMAAGRQTFEIAPGIEVPDGSYELVVTASDGRTEVTASAPVIVDRILAALAAARPLFSPNGDGRLDVVRFTFSLARDADAKLRILRDGRWVATPFSGSLRAGPQELVYDGSKRIGRLLDGSYEAELQVTTLAGTVARRVPFASDTTPPRVKLVSVRPLRLEVSEPAKVVVWVNGRRLALAAGGVSVRVPWPGVARRIRAVAWDAAGNVSRPASFPQAR